jgi:hypothetical protein
LKEGFPTASIVIEKLELFEQPPVVVYATEYVPAEDVLKSIVPVELLRDNPADELKVPPEVPVTIGVGSGSVAQ